MGSAASYYEPPDPWEKEWEGCEDGCLLDHNPEETDCWTYEDAEADEADREYDRRKDGD